MRNGSWPLAGLVLGGLAGAAWGWFGSGGYEAGDSAIGTGVMGAVAGALVGAVAAAVAVALAGRRRR